MNDKKKLWIGIIMLVSFAAVLYCVLGPVWGGKSGLEVADEAFNSLAKNSAYYIPKQIKSAQKFEGKSFEMSLKTKSPEETQLTARLFESAGAEVTESDGKLTVKGDLGKVTLAALADADAVFKNDKAAITAKYGNVNDREVVYTWYNAFKQMQKKFLTDPTKAKEALLMKGINEKALEPTYNFYGLEAKPLSAHTALIIGLLVFYFIYTCWYGFGIMYIFEGLGIVAHAGAKQEN